MTHAPSFALASLLFLLLVGYRDSGRLRLALAAGGVLGLAILVRYGAVGLLPAALLAVLLRGDHPRPRNAALALGTFAAGFTFPLLLLPLYWHAGAGGWRPTGYGGSWRVTLASPWNVLLSPHHGLFVFHPALLLAALGLAWAAGVELRRRAPGMGTVALARLPRDRRPPRLVVRVDEPGRLRPALPDRRPSRPRPRLRADPRSAPPPGLAGGPRDGHDLRLPPLLYRGRRPRPAAPSLPLAPAADGLPHPPHLSPGAGGDLGRDEAGFVADAGGVRGKLPGLS